MIPSTKLRRKLSPIHTYSRRESSSSFPMQSRKEMTRLAQANHRAKGQFFGLGLNASLLKKRFSDSSTLLFYQSNIHFSATIPNLCSSGFRPARPKVRENISLTRGVHRVSSLRAKNNIACFSEKLAEIQISYPFFVTKTRNQKSIS